MLAKDGTYENEVLGIKSSQTGSIDGVAVEPPDGNKNNAEVPLLANRVWAETLPKVMDDSLSPPGLPLNEESRGKKDPEQEKLEALGGAPASMPEPKEIHVVKHFEWMDVDADGMKEMKEAMRRITLHTFRADDLPLYKWKQKWIKEGKEVWQQG